MYTIFNKITFEWGVTDDPSTLPNSDIWVINPTFVDQERCMMLGPKKWVFEPDSVIRPMTDEEIDTNPSFVAALQDERINELSISCQAEIEKGFFSSALGSPRWYDAEDVDQINMIGATIATAPTAQNPSGTSIYYASRTDPTGIKEYLPHTHEQLKQCLDDGASMKLSNLQKFHIKRVYIQQCTRLSTIELVTWDSVEIME